MLNPAAKAEVQKLLGSQTLADVASWADSQKAGTPYWHTSWYHFEKMDDGVNFIPHLRQLDEDKRKKGGIIGAILIAQKTLRSDRSSQLEREVALKFLVHFIGDLHQPLHSGRPEDKGGVTIDVEWFNRKTSLHGVWDTSMILTGHEDLFTDPSATADYPKIYARWLAQQYRNWRPDPQTVMNVEGWLHESLQLRPRAYVKTYESDQREYTRRNLDVIDQRIYAAAYRLAQNLNSIFGGNPVPGVERDLWRRINSVLTDLHRYISLDQRPLPPLAPPN